MKNIWGDVRVIATNQVEYSRQPKLLMASFMLNGRVRYSRGSAL